MPPYRFSTLRRLLDCEAQFLLADHDVDNAEIEIGRVGHKTMEQALRGQRSFPNEFLMRKATAGILLASPVRTKELRDALISLPNWYTGPEVAPSDTVLVEAPIWVVLSKAPIGQEPRITGSRAATPKEILAGRSDDGWLYRATVDYAVVPDMGVGVLDIVDWKFDRVADEEDSFHRSLQSRLYALAAWIRYGGIVSRKVRVTTVYVFLKTTEETLLGTDELAAALADLEALLRRADAVTSTAPAKASHARPGPKCGTCTVSHVCPAVDAAVREMRHDTPGWIGRASDWVLLRRRVSDLEAFLREKARVEGPIPIEGGYEVGFGPEGEFGIWRAREVQR